MYGTPSLMMQLMSSGPEYFTCFSHGSNFLNVSSYSRGQRLNFTVEVLHPVLPPKSFVRNRVVSNVLLYELGTTSPFTHQISLLISTPLTTSCSTKSTLPCQMDS